jgi:hypothetical protein
MNLKTATRYVVDGATTLAVEKHETKAAAQTAAGELERKERALNPDLPDGAMFTVRRATFAIERYAVASNRDGELVVIDVDEDTAKAEAQRLTVEQYARRHGGTIAGQAVEAQALNTGSLDELHRRDVGADLPTTTYAVVHLQDREIIDEEGQS